MEAVAFYGRSSSCVRTVPVFFSQKQKFRVEDAADRLHYLGLPSTSLGLCPVQELIHKCFPQ